MLESGATSPTNGLLRLPANSVKEGKILSVEAEGLVGGKAVSIVGGHSGTDTTGSLLHVASSAPNGKAVEIIGSSNLGVGKLLDISTSSKSANSAISLTANEMVSGSLVSIDTQKLENGTALSVSGGNGDPMHEGSLVHVTSDTISADVGMMRLSAHNIKEGKILAVEAGSLVDGKAVSITGGSTKMKSGSLLHVSSDALSPTSGVVQFNSQNG